MTAIGRGYVQARHRRYGPRKVQDDGLRTWGEVPDPPEHFPQRESGQGSLDLAHPETAAEINKPDRYLQWFSTFTGVWC